LAKLQGNRKRAGRGALATAAYPGDIIPERPAKSSRNAERHQIVLAGDIIPDSRATSPGISRMGHVFREDVGRRTGSEFRHDEHLFLGWSVDRQSRDGGSRRPVRSWI
jgi:hypothetical protein